VVAQVAASQGELSSMNESDEWFFIEKNMSSLKCCKLYSNKNE
jgi:hypothetical protein